jgi:hypothetical protein
MTTRGGANCSLFARTGFLPFMYSGQSSEVYIKNENALGKIVNG